MSMLDWNGYRQQLSATIAEIARTDPDLVRGYRMLATSRAKSGALDAKTRELVALAVSVTLRCDGCITTHVDLARKQRATADEITDALGIAVMVNSGAALVDLARTLDAFHSGGPAPASNSGQSL